MSSREMQAQNSSPVKSYLDGFVIVTTVSIVPVPLYGYQTLIYLAFNPISYPSHTPELPRNP